MTKINAIIEVKDVYSIPETQILLLKGYATIYRWIKSGKIHTVKISNRTLIPKSEIDRIKGKIK